MSEDFMKFCLQCKHHNTTSWKSSHKYHHVCLSLPLKYYGNRSDTGTLLWKSLLPDSQSELVITDEKACPMYLEFVVGGNQNVQRCL